MDKLHFRFREFVIFSRIVIRPGHSSELLFAALGSRSSQEFPADCTEAQMPELHGLHLYQEDVMM